MGKSFSDGRELAKLMTPPAGAPVPAEKDGVSARDQFRVSVLAGGVELT